MHARPTRKLEQGPRPGRANRLVALSAVPQFLVYALLGIAALSAVPPAQAECTVSNDRCDGGECTVDLDAPIYEGDCQDGACTVNLNVCWSGGACTVNLPYSGNCIS